MVRPSIEVADIFAAHAGAFVEGRGVVSSATRRVLHDLSVCRTAALGGHIERCDSCDYEQVAYNSCRNRHCPKCQATARAAWLEARAADLLPVEYFHVVFTVPAQIAEIALQNKRVMYDILLRASARTLLKIAADPRHLGAKIGFLSVLHTWGQNLMHHPHVHCVVPGGGLSSKGRGWVSCPSGFFLPVRVLSRVFRGKFLEMTRKAFAERRLSFHGNLEGLNHPDAFDARLTATLANDWVVYAKPPFGGPEQVLKYLANYTHRVAISNHRLISLEDDQVRFRFRDYARGNRKRTMTLEATEFIRRFLLHVLPQGFVRIRHFGLLANSCRRDKLARCRKLIGSVGHDVTITATENVNADGKLGTCPVCGQHLVRIELLPCPAQRTTATRPPALIDSS